MGRATLDLENPPVPTADELASLDAMTPDEIERNALADPDNPPLTASELARLRPIRGPEAASEPPRRAIRGR